MASKLKPIIFVAFADPQDIPGAGLPNLRAEETHIAEALKDVCALGSWEFVSGLNCTRADLVEQFNSDRVAVFHYGGHASPQSLLLPAESKGNQVVSGLLLEDFLAQQKSLKLAFFNACSTRQWAEKLAGNIPYVVATVAPVADEMAQDLASVFYACLAADNTIEEAFAKASAAVILEHESLQPAMQGVETDPLFKSHATRRMDVEDDPDSEGPVFPWILLKNPALGEDARWTFSVGAHDPLVGLPLLKPAEYTLPERPYVTIKGHREEDAPLFFGRNAEIRTLYDWALSQDERAPVLLFYGQSGAGKSSLLNAGLLPRLRKKCEVVYRRRNRDLTEELESAIGGGTDEAILAWLDADEPKLILLDQVEEAITHNAGSAEEMRRFIERVKDIFARRKPGSTARLLLSFRKEYLAEIQGLFARESDEGSPELVERFWLDRLDADGIVEVIEGPVRNKQLREEYRITLEDGFAEFVASKLNDPHSPIATVLQILLNKLWDKAHEHAGDPVYTRELYGSLSALDNPLQGFYGDQLDKLYASDGAAKYRNGVELDLLVEHTTDLGTSRRRTLQQLKESYPQVDGIEQLIQANKDLYLLTEPEKDEADGGAAATTVLSHDTLAPVIRRDFALSVTPGARARRLVQNRAREWVGGKTGNPLDAIDLRTVRRGRKNMRALNDDEQRLLTASVKRAWRNTALAASVLIGILAIGGGVAEHYRALADQQAQTKRSVRLAEDAKAALQSRYDLAVLLSIAAYQEAPTNEARNAIYNVFLAKPDAVGMLPWSGTHVKEPGGGVSLSGDGDWLAASYGHTVEFWNISTKTRVWSANLPGRATKIDPDNVTGIALNPDGTLVAFSVRGQLQVWRTADRFPLIGRNALTGTSTQAFSTDGKYLANLSCTQIQVWTMPDMHPVRNSNTGRMGCQNDSSGKDLAGFVFNPADSNQMAVIYSAGRVEVQDTTTGKVLRTIQQASPKDTGGTYNALLLPALAFSGDGNWLAASTGSSGIDVHNLKTGTHVGTIKPGKAIMALGLNEDGSRLVSTTDQGEFAVWDTASLHIVKPFSSQVGRWNGGTLDDRALMGHTVLGNAIAPSLTPIAVQMSDGDVLLLDAKRSWGAEPAQTAGSGDGPGQDVRTSAMAYSPDGKWIATAGYNGMVRLWDVATSQQRWQFQNAQSKSISIPMGNDGSAVALKGRGVHSVAFANDGRVLALPLSGSDDTPKIDLYLLDTEHLSRVPDLTDKVLQTRKSIDAAGQDDQVEKEATITNVVAGPNGAIVARSNLGMIRAGNASQWSLMAGFPDMGVDNESIDSDSMGSGMALSADGKLLAVPGPGETRFSVWTVNGDHVVEAFAGDAGNRANALAFSPAGSATALLAEGDEDGFSLWNTTTGQRVGGDSDGAVGGVWSLAFSPDGSLLAIVSDGGRVQLWDIALGEMLGEDLQTREPIKQNSLGLVVDDFARGAAFSPDGKRIAIGSTQGGYRLLNWDIEPDKWQDAGCSIVHRNLTQKEWEKYIPDETYRLICPILRAAKTAKPKKSKK